METRSKQIVEISIQIDGDPVAWARPRLSQKRFFTDPTRKAYEDLIKLRATEAITAKGYGPISKDCGVAVVIQCFLRRPKNHFDKHGNVKIQYYRSAVVKPDVDNLEKIVYDALKGIAYVDDCQIVESSAVKYWCNDDNPKTNIYIINRR